MSEAWFPPEGALWFTGLCALGLTALAAPAISKGRYRTIVVGIWRAIIALGFALLAAGLVAWRGHQPLYVTLPLTISGGVIGAGYALSLVFVLKGYRVAEQRKVAAREL
ncbi:hypothetical protein [Asticcacaulis solisilvae]|uniref:hypothetical protein n=1 Tax=Asticcacaulis solisilvae TaxID=1217274 RepID=UPI003FD82B15